MDTSLTRDQKDADQPGRNDGMTQACPQYQPHSHDQQSQQQHPGRHMDRISNDLVGRMMTAGGHGTPTPSRSTTFQVAQHARRRRIDDAPPNKRVSSAISAVHEQ
jgi:hypothetical protein